MSQIIISYLNYKSQFYKIQKIKGNRINSSRFFIFPHLLPLNTAKLSKRNRIS